MIEPGTAVLVDWEGELTPAVICKFMDGEYLLSNVYWPTRERPPGFAWGGWFKASEVWLTIEEAEA